MKTWGSVARTSTLKPIIPRPSSLTQSPIPRSSFLRLLFFVFWRLIPWQRRKQRTIRRQRIPPLRVLLNRKMRMRLRRRRTQMMRVRLCMCRASRKTVPSSELSDRLSLSRRSRRPVLCLCLWQRDMRILSRCRRRVAGLLQRHIPTHIHRRDRDRARDVLSDVSLGLWRIHQLRLRAVPHPHLRTRRRREVG